MASVKCGEFECSDSHFFAYVFVIGIGAIAKKVMFLMAITRDKNQKGRQILSGSRMTYCGIGMFLTLRR